MSALPPKADIVQHGCDVRFVPEAEVAVGPALDGSDGRKAGTVEGYDYSEVNKNSGIVWSEATFKEYLIDPSAKILGTKMIFSDKNEQEGLKQFGSDGRNS